MLRPAVTLPQSSATTSVGRKRFDETSVSRSVNRCYQLDNIKMVQIFISLDLVPDSVEISEMSRAQKFAENVVSSSSCGCFRKAAMSTMIRDYKAAELIL